MKIAQLLSGNKTHLTVAVGAVLLFGEWQHWWQIDQKVYEALVGAAIVFIRLGIAKMSQPQIVVSSPAVTTSGGPVLSITTGTSGTSA
jgi:hypothetical protein